MTAQVQGNEICIGGYRSPLGVETPGPITTLITLIAASKQNCQDPHKNVPGCKNHCLKKLKAVADPPGVYSFLQLECSVINQIIFTIRHVAGIPSLSSFWETARNYLKVKFVLRGKERVVLTLYLQLLLL